MAVTLENKTAVVTGASSGIGRAIAVSFATAGADLLLHARANQEGLKEVAGEVRELGRSCETCLADLADVAGRDELLQRVDAWKPVDIWVNNAGADVLTGSIAEASFFEKLACLWRMDVEGTLDLSRRIGERMRDRGGVILNMGWDQAEQGMAGDAGEMFSTIKGAIMAFSRSLAQSLAPEVRVNCLAPGWIRTVWGEGATDYWQQRACEESLRNRWGRPEDVAEAATYLASDAADFITGQVFPVNGGFRFRREAKSDGHTDD